MSEKQLTPKEVNEQIDKLLKEAEAKISEAEALAEKYGVIFSWSGPAYGMGGSYRPNGWNDSGCEWETSDSEDGWYPSSQSC